jgi:hypothetical protein
LLPDHPLHLLYTIGKGDYPGASRLSTLGMLVTILLI